MGTICIKFVGIDGMNKTHELFAHSDKEVDEIYRYRPALRIQDVELWHQRRRSSKPVPVCKIPGAWWEKGELMCYQSRLCMRLTELFEG